MGFYRDVTLLVGVTRSWITLKHAASLLLQYMAFFEFNNRLEAILTKAYIYR